MSITKKIREQGKAQTSGRIFRPSTSITPTADWGRVDAESLRSALGAVTANGGALRLGLTRDGGAFSVGIYGDGPEPYTVYVRPNESMEDFLGELEQAFYVKQNATRKIIEEVSPPTASELP